MNTRKPIQRSHIVWSIVALSLAIMPHAGRFSVSMLLCFGALAAWRLLGEYHYLPLPNRRHIPLWVLKQFLAVAAFVAIYITYQGQLGRSLTQWIRKVNEPLHPGDVVASGGGAGLIEQAHVS